MQETDFNRPEKGAQAFGQRVSSADQAGLQAFVMPSAGTYVVGFQRAADIIVDGTQGDDLNPDDLFFPIAHLYRHHLELLLKELVRLGVRLRSLKDCDKILGEHNLHRLWNKAKQLIKEVSADSLNTDLTAVEQVVFEFHKLDPTGQAFRYHRDKKGTPHLKDALKIVDLGNLKATVDTVSSWLDAAYAAVEHCDPRPP